MMKFLMLIFSLVVLVSQITEGKMKIKSSFDFGDRTTMSKLFKYDNLKKLRTSDRPAARARMPIRQADEECIDQCAERLEVNEELVPFLFNVIGDTFDDDNSTTIKRLFDEPMLKQYCGLINGLVSCMKQCPKQEEEDEILKFMRTSLYICNETNFVQYAKCYRQVYDEDMNKCDSAQKCGPYRYSNFIEGINEDEQENATSYIYRASDNLCHYITCGLDCRKSELVSKCGQNQQAVLAKFYQTLMHSFEKVIKLFVEEDDEDEDEIIRVQFSERCNKISQAV